MINPKPKKCKGTGLAKGNGCGTEVLHRKYGLGLYCCYNKWLLNTPEGKEQLQKMTLKAAQPRISLEKAIKDSKHKSKIQAHLVNTKEIVHEMIRLRDKGKPCISCGCQWNSDFQAGHCFAVNNYRSIRFNFDNISGQCEYCNLFLDGNVPEYILSLPNRIGVAKFDELKSLARRDKKFIKKWSRDELAEIREKARQIIKQLK